MNFLKSAAASVTSSDKKDAGSSSLQDQIATLVSGNAALKKTIEDLKQKLAGVVGGAVAAKAGAAGAAAAEEGKEKAEEAKEQADAAVKKGEEGKEELEKKIEELGAEKESLEKKVDRLRKEVEDAAADKAEEAKDQGLKEVTKALGAFEF